MEWRERRDLLKHKEDDRLMFFRLDDADIPGRYSIDGYRDIRTMTGSDVAAAILFPLRPNTPQNAPRHHGQDPSPQSTLIGREEELAFLD